MADKFYVNDTPLIRLDAVNSIAGASGVYIHFIRPDTTSGAWPATVDVNRYVEYQTIAGDLNIRGTWKLQSYMTIGNWTGHGETAKVEIYDRGT
jgi:hypothetical protein